MDSQASSTVPEAKQTATRAQNHSSDNKTQQHLNRRFSPEDKCYLAHHVNQCYDWEDLCQTFNRKFGTDRNLESITKFLSNCDDDLFFDLTEQALDYKWCKPHPISQIAPPSMVLGTAEWRTELRAFLVYQALSNVTLAKMKQNLSTTFPGESRTLAQIQSQLAKINTKQGMVRQLKQFSSRYTWHPSYKGDTGNLNMPGNKSKAGAKAEAKAEAEAAARARLEEEKKKAKGYEKDLALAVALQKFLKQRTGTTITGPQDRPGHTAGRARSASPAKDRGLGDRKVGIERGNSVP